LALGGFTAYVVSLVIRQGILLLQNIPVYQQSFSQTVENLCGSCDQVMDLSTGTSYRYVELQMTNLYENISGEILPHLSGYVTQLMKGVLSLGGGSFLFFLATVLLLFEDRFPRIRGSLRPFVHRLKGAGLAYMKAQFILLFVSATVLSVGFFILGNRYAVLLGIGIAVFDAFPVVGSGIVFIPWSIINLINGRYYETAILLTMFCIITLLREVLEPKLFGKEVGLKPLYVLIAVYAGIKLFGLAGVILGPIALTIGKVAVEEISQ
jgi:predicted PurR-regulated permease PerM